ncbi:hypothetical protein Tco_0088892 [Tanacetum coccineum]
MGSFINWYCKQIGNSKLIKADLEDQTDLLNLEGNRVVHDISKPLPLGGLPSQVTIQTQYFFNKDLEYFVSGDKERRNAYGISHWCFKCKEFYITRHSTPSNRSAVRSHMKILSVVSLKTFSRYGYTYLKEIVLHRADYKECQSSSTTYLEPNKEELHHDLKPRAIIYRDKNNQKKMMRETEVHKFNYGMLTRILENLDVMVKDYVLFKFNPGMEHTIWSEDDKRRSQEFLKLIERRLKIRRIFRSLESFVSGRLRDIYNNDSSKRNRSVSHQSGSYSPLLALKDDKPRELHQPSTSQENNNDHNDTTSKRTITAWRKMHEIDTLKAIIEYYNVAGTYHFVDQGHMQKFYED